MNIRNCLQCNNKLGTRNYTSRGKSITHLCQRCFNKPIDKHRCIGINVKNKRCKARKLNGSEYCSSHKKRGVVNG